MRVLSSASLLPFAAVAVLGAAGCDRSLYEPALATRAFPAELHQPVSVDMQVFRQGQRMEIVNATARSYHDVDVWLNKRFVHHVEAIPAGETVRVSLWDFFDGRGERFNAGGFWRTEAPTPLRLVQLQTGPGEPMIGLILVVDEG